MGLSSTQGWSQTLLQAQMLELPNPASMKRPLQQYSEIQQQQGEQLKCPRCDSTNTKFCDYNNYNKSQPRHFCKTCKRYWTNGGILRNVPFGAGRKYKRLKTSNGAATSTATATDSRVDTHVAVQSQQQRQNLPFTPGDPKNFADAVYQPLIHPPSNLEIKDMSTNNSGSLISSNLVVPQNQSLNVPYESSSSLNPTPSSISIFELSDVINYAEETVEEPTDIMISPTSMPITSSSTVTQPWQVVYTSSGMDSMTSYWNWDGIDTLVSTDLNIPMP